VKPPPAIVPAAVLAAGLTVGTLAPEPASAPPLRLDTGETVLAADFHVHAFLGDGWLPPWELLREARRRGLDAIAVTNHNQVLAAHVVRRLTRQVSGPLVLVGQEVTAPEYHMTAAGIERRIDWWLDAREAVARIHAQGGVAIAAHPRVRYWPALDGALDVLDGAEAAHPLMIGNARGRAEILGFYGRASEVRVRPVAAIGSSDYHVLTALGLCRTLVLARERTEAAVLDAVREGRTVAEDPDGVLYGPPELVALVQRAGAPARPPSRTRREGWAAALSWSGLLGLLLAPRRR
jgi:hypothetical protein